MGSYGVIMHDHLCSSSNFCRQISATSYPNANCPFLTKSQDRSFSLKIPPQTPFSDRIAIHNFANMIATFTEIRYSYTYARMGRNYSTILTFLTSVPDTTFWLSRSFSYSTKSSKILGQASASLYVDKSFPMVSVKFRNMFHVSRGTPRM